MPARKPPGPSPGLLQIQMPDGDGAARPRADADMDGARRGRRRLARASCARSRCAAPSSWWPTSTARLLAYRSACAGCHASLGDATLSGEILTCARCGRGFDLPRAGRALGSEEGQLEPVPLLGRAGTKVKVALAP